ncbi:uncharacterized protein LOC126109657 [Schistocerca cancellata]|uniref:uncharacterized protein LOC126109657 n=1 Tax=Schistocerca cancellata TaxID=274614 RepID=UPI002117E192|nr:uncharacterized protein LOC126109657 [Schistocerca cancellata]
MEMIENYILRYKSAKKIQSVWRGYSTRKHFPHIRCELEREKAAIKIQRAVREWLYYRTVTSAGEPDRHMWRITKEDLERLEEEVAQWQEECDSSQLPSPDELQQVCQQVRLKLAHFQSSFLKNRSLLHSLQHRVRLLQEVQSVLIALPNLEDSSDLDLSFFRRVPRQAAVYARLRHRFSFLMLDQPDDEELPSTPVDTGDAADGTATSQQ